MAHPSDIRAVNTIADASADTRRTLVATAEEAGVAAGSLRNLRLEGLVVVLDEDGHPTICITDAGRNVLQRQPTLFST